MTSGFSGILPGDISLASKHGLVRRLALLPIFILPLLLVLFLTFDPHLNFESPFILIVVNFFFLTIPTLLVAFYSARIYLTQGLASALCFGSGMAAYGAAGLAIGFVPALGLDPNILVTVHNLGVLAFAVGITLSTYLSLRDDQRQTHGRGKPLLLAGAYAGMILLILLIFFLCLNDLLPRFFTEDKGPTNIRQLVLITSMILLAFSTSRQSDRHRQRPSAFTYWCMLGFILIIIGIICFSLVVSVGNHLGWLGRASQFLGFGFILIGMVAAYRETGQSVEHAIRVFLQDDIGYRMFVENSPDIIAKYDYELRHTYINPTVTQLTGLPVSFFLHRTPAEVGVEGESLKAMEAALRGALKDGEEKVAEVEYTAPEGSRVYHCRCMPERDRRGKVAGVICIGRDITEIKRKEKALRESEERFRAIFQLCPEAMVIADSRDGRILDVNQAYCTFLGYPREELINRTSEELGLWADTSQRAAILDILAEQGTAQDYEGRLRTKTGDIRTTLISVGFLILYDRRCMLTVLKDISERKRLEELLRTSEERFRLALSAASMGAYSRNMQTGENYWSPEFLAIYGLGPGDPLPLQDGIPAAVHPEDRPLIVAEAHARLDPANGSKFSSEHRIVRPTGEVRWVQIHGKVDFGPGGEPRASYGLAMDITERRRMEEDLRQAKQAAEEANKTKSEFLASMSHEIRTPMNGVIGMAQLGLMVEDEPRSREYFELIQKSGRALLGIINDILDLSKIEAGKVVLEMAPFNLREELRMVLSACEASAHEKSLRFVQTMASNIPARLAGDSVRLRQVLTNLVGNAVKFTHEGVISVSVDLADEAASRPEGLRLRFRVRDTGIGIPSDKLADVFDCFKQVGDQDRAKYGGTGLGLTISKRLVELMEGRIWAESELGKGSTFTFIAEFGLLEDKIEPAKENVSVTRRTQSLRILLVEDNEINCLVAKELLQAQGHSIRIAEDGRKALDALQEEAFDLVFMDAQMPGMDGVEATRRIRAGEAGNPNVPIVALTAYALKGDREKFLAAGMNDYLSKPIDLKELDRVLERVGTGVMGK